MSKRNTFKFCTSYFKRHTYEDKGYEQKKSKKQNNTYMYTMFVSKSMQTTSCGGSYRSKYRESTPTINGTGALSTVARDKGQRGM